MRNIVSDIFTWSWFSEPHGYNFNGHLVRNPDGNICIDPVELTEDDMDTLIGEGVARIILTNRNHSRAANRVRTGTGARTVIHADDADHARSQETELDDALEVGSFSATASLYLRTPKPGSKSWLRRLLINSAPASIGVPMPQTG